MKTFTAVVAAAFASTLVTAAPVTSAAASVISSAVATNIPASSVTSAASSQSTSSGTTSSGNSTSSSSGNSTSSSSGSSASSPTVKTSQGTFIGSNTYGVESFKGIPFALPPVGQLRFAPPQADNRTLGTFNATEFGASCWQMTGQGNPVAAAIIGTFEAAALGENPLAASSSKPNNQSEDCLSVNVFRPQGTTSNSSLPVMVWIYGGGFLFGESATYDPTAIMLQSMASEKPVIYVSLNYRLNSFGFLPGRQAAEDNSTSINAGLLDQRLALEWVHKNIDTFGGDSEKVTIFGESAGAISVAYQMLAYNGNISSSYDGKPLFRGAIMESGAPTPAGPASRGQFSFDTIANATNCTSGDAQQQISCFRNLSAGELLNATNLLPNLDSGESFPSMLDYSFISETANKLVKERRYAQNVSIISGNQWDEGTILTLGTGLNITTTDALDNWLATTFSPNSTAEERSKLLELYPEDVTQGSPYDTGDLYALAPQSKRIASLLGDEVFQAPRRAFLNQTKETQPTWSYASRAFNNTPLLGSFHSSDVLSLYGARAGAPGPEMRQRWIQFAYSLNPNVEGYIDWPEYKNNLTLLEFTNSNSTTITDDYRKEQMDYIISIEESLIV
ncbi:uncharacterized protein JCM15063_000150 [Sporobolomyces koalae]|uniref:uncharacterized protein n=1 Tax=Sporobolomyces koalae TaxID=500713 RepID=UPI003178ECBB